MKTETEWQARALEVALDLSGKKWWTFDVKESLLAFAKEYAAEALAEVERLKAHAVSVYKEQRSSHLRQEATIADLRAQLAAAGLVWQPIETAPKDGTDFLAWHPDTRVGITFWNGSTKWYGYNTPDDSPTHWQPLPAPPKEGE